MRREVPRNIPPVVGSNQGPATTCRQTDPLDFGLKLPSDPMRVPAPKGDPCVLNLHVQGFVSCAAQRRGPASFRRLMGRSHDPPYPRFGHGQIATSTVLLGGAAAQLGSRPRDAEHNVLYGVVREHLDAVLRTAGRGLCRLSAIAHLKLAPGPDTPGPAPPQLDHTAATP